MEVKVVSIDGVFGELQMRPSTQQRRHRNLDLQPSQGCAQAIVNAATEADVRIGVASEVKSMRGVKHIGIPVGGSQQQRDFLANVKALPVHLHGLTHPAIELMQWCVES